MNAPSPRALTPVIPDEAMRAQGERRFDPGPRVRGRDSLHEIPDSLAFGSASGMTGASGERESGWSQL